MKNDPQDNTTRRNVVLGAALMPAAATLAVTSASAGGPKHPPECDHQQDCRFIGGMSTATLLYCPGSYDRSGNYTPAEDCNKYTTSWTCAGCGKSWSEEG